MHLLSGPGARGTIIPCLKVINLGYVMIWGAPLQSALVKTMRLPPLKTNLERVRWGKTRFSEKRRFRPGVMPGGPVRGPVCLSHVCTLGCHMCNVLACIEYVSFELHLCVE